MTNPLKLSVKTAVFVALGLSLAGCSSSGLVNSLTGGKTSAQATPQVPMGNSLAMPPDLQLRAPGTTTEAYQPNTAQGAPVDGAIDQGDLGVAPDTTMAATPAPGAPAAPKDNYEKYGINRLNPDGTPKTMDQLQKELKAAVIAEKRRTNPNYGTIFNMGNVFSDG